MKLKIYTLYTAGLALLVGAAAVGDGFNALPATAWGGQALVSIGLACFGRSKRYSQYCSRKRRRQQGAWSTRLLHRAYRV